MISGLWRQKQQVRRPWREQCWRNEWKPMWLGYLTVSGRWEITLDYGKGFGKSKGAVGILQSIITSITIVSLVIIVLSVSREPDWSYGDISGQNPLTREYPPAGSKVKQGCLHSGSTTHHLHIWPNLGEAYSLTWMKDVTMWMSWRLYSGEDRMLEKHKRGYHPMVSLCQARSSSREGQPPMHFPICELASMSLNQITAVGWRGSRWEESGRIKVIARS